MSYNHNKSFNKAGTGYSTNGSNGINGSDLGSLIAEEQRMVKSGKFIAFGSDFAMRNLISTTGYLGVFLGVTGLLQKVFEDILTNTAMHSAIMEEMNPIFPHHFAIKQNEGSSGCETEKVKFILQQVVRKFVKGTTQSDTDVFIFGSVSELSDSLIKVERKKASIEVIDVKRSDGKAVLAVAQEIQEEFQEIEEQEVEILSQIDKLIQRDLGKVSDNTRSRTKEVDMMNVVVVDDKTGFNASELSVLEECYFLLEDETLFALMQQCNYRKEKVIKKCSPTDTGETTYYHSLLQRQRHLKLKHDEQHQKNKGKVRDYIIPLLNGFLTVELQREVQEKMAKLNEGMTIKDYWTLFLQCSLSSLKDCNSTVETKIEVDRYLALQVQKVRKARSKGVGEVYRQLELAMRDVMQLTDRWNQFNLTLHSEEGALPMALLPANLMQCLQMMISEVSAIDIHGADRLRLLTKEGSWTLVQDHVVEFNRRNVETKSQHQQPQHSIQRREAERPNRIMFTSSNSGTEIPRAKLQQIIKGAVELAGIKMSKTSSSNRDYILVKNVVQSHLMYNNWCFPKNWCMLCGGDHKRFACPECRE